jgi:hypothetical protein
MVYDLFEGEREMTHADYELWLTAWQQSSTVI